MGWDTHLVARFGQQMIVFGAAFFGARFAAKGAQRDLVLSNEKQHSLEQCGLLAWLALGGVEDVGKMAHGVQGAFEAEPAQIDLIA